MRTRLRWIITAAVLVALCTGPGRPAPAGPSESDAVSPDATSEAEAASKESASDETQKKRSEADAEGNEQPAASSASISISVSTDGENVTVKTEKKPADGKAAGKAKWQGRGEGVIVIGGANGQTVIRLGDMVVSQGGAGRAHSTKSPGDTVDALNDPAHAADLGLTEAQAKALADLKKRADAVRAELEGHIQVYRDLRTLPADQRKERMQTAAEERRAGVEKLVALDAEALEVLTPEQRETVRTIHRLMELQGQGPWALTSDEVAASLDLSAEQVETIRAALQQASADRARATRDAFAGLGESRDLEPTERARLHEEASARAAAAHAEIEATTRREVEAVLTPEQRAGAAQYLGPVPGGEAGTNLGP